MLYTLATDKAAADFAKLKQEGEAHSPIWKHYLNYAEANDQEAMAEIMSATLLEGKSPALNAHYKKMYPATAKVLQDAYDEWVKTHK